MTLIRRLTTRTGLALSGALLVACGGSGPVPLRVTEDACEVCRMAITDTRFGGEVLLTTGRHRTFDAVECLASWMATSTDTSRIQGIYVSDYEHDTLIDARTAVYVQGGALKSPMGRSLAAFAAGTDTSALKQRLGGTILDWNGVRSIDTGHEH